MSETWKPTTSGGHHVRNVERLGDHQKPFCWRGEVCLNTGSGPSEDPRDWRSEVWYDRGYCYGIGPRSDFDLVAINSAEVSMDWKERIKQWAADRNLIEGSMPLKQMDKLDEEVMELYDGLTHANIDDIKDAIGDIQVVLAVMCAQLDLDIDECREIAWEQIKDRKGKMVDGVFVKEVQGE